MDLQAVIIAGWTFKFLTNSNPKSIDFGIVFSTLANLDVSLNLEINAFL